MGLSVSNKIAIITRDTRLEGLLQRWATKGAARFRLTQAHAHQQALATSHGRRELPKVDPEVAGDAEFAEYEEEDQTYRMAVEAVRRGIDLGLQVETVHRRFLPNFDFARCLVVVVIGQDGLVANAAKYVGDRPIVAVNPDPSRFDGVLLPFAVEEAPQAVASTLRGRIRERRVTLAEVNLNDGQRMLAFNDFFVGTQGHASARYILTAGGTSESQSSSGLIVSTGAGSTGWVSSIFKLATGVTCWLGGPATPGVRLEWEAQQLLWAVREPFQSKHSQARLVAGQVEATGELVVESLMPERGLIFSDGIESDFLEFNSGTIARIRCAGQQARLVVKD